MLFFANVTTFVMTLWMDKFTSIVMDDLDLNEVLSVWGSWSFFKISLINHLVDQSIEWTWCIVHYILYLVSNGILCHHSNFSNDIPYE